MTVTYTNRKGVTYYLCRGLTRSGKPRYYFAREPQGEPVEAIPSGFAVRESVNGVVSLVKVRPSQLLPEEMRAVEAALRRRPQAPRYRLDARHDRIVIYEQVGADADDIVATFRNVGIDLGGRVGALRADLELRAQYAPVLRFILEDATSREFRVERWCYLGSVDDWIDVHRTGPVADLAKEVIPKLGTDEFYEL